jgi:3-hydroxypropanoate dehydrogenase
MQDLTMPDRIDDTALRQLFLDARTHNKWRSKDVPDSLLKDVVDIMKMGPTSANCSPARIIFVRSKAKERLKSHLEESNKEKTMQAPICAIIGYDLKFYEHLPKLFPHVDAKSWFEGKPEFIKTTAFRNGLSD